jgi:choline dehydrogenase-like flavoprotein
LPVGLGSRPSSADPLDQPLIDPNYLADPEDLAQFIAGIRLTRGSSRPSPSTASWVVKLAPGADAQSDEAIAAYVRDRASGTIFHPVGSCRMGMTGRRYGAESARRGRTARRRRSVMPTLIGGNTNAPTIMIAEKAAAMMLGA